VGKRSADGAFDLAAVNPRGDSPQAIARGQQLYADNCAVCHGAEGRGEPDIAPSVLDDAFLGEPGDGSDGAYFAIIAGGSDAKAAIGRKGLPDGGMNAYGGQISNDDIWAVISFLRAQKAHEAREKPRMEQVEHPPATPKP
jgi:cytochrome c oxidase cbb3-type subunit 2